jgi:nucleolar protein 56
MKRNDGTMKATILETSFGILAFNDENGLVEKVLFPRKPQTVAKALLKIENGKVIQEISSLVDLLQKSGYDTFVFENAALAREIESKLNVVVEIQNPSAAGALLRSRIEQFAVETGFVPDISGFRLWTHNITMELSKLKVKEAVEKRDLMIAQAILALDDLDKVTNLFMSHAREWYGIHFPELDRLLEKHETYARLLVKLGSRDNFTIENLEKEDIPKQKAEAIMKTAELSMGADLEETDLQQIQTLSKSILDLFQLRQGLESYLDTTMEEVAPNTKTLAGSLLGARLIAISGGLSNLAMRPASTIQVLGAEKALFRSLKTGTRPPKHGVIFQHTLLHDAKKWQRGKIARALAGKLAIAARTDAFGRRDISRELTQDLEKRIEEIRDKYAEPPPPQAAQPRHERPAFQRRKERRHRREDRR